MSFKKGLATVEGCTVARSQQGPGRDTQGVCM